MNPPSPVLAVVVAALLATSCASESNADIGPVREAVDALDSAQSDLRQRLTELETALSAIATGGEQTDVPATGLLDQLATLQDLVTQLETELGQEVIDRTEDSAEANATFAAIQDLIADVQRDIDDLIASLQTLREEHDLLVSRFDRHLADHS